LHNNYAKKLKDQPAIEKCEKHLRIMAERIKKGEEEIKYYQQVLASIQAKDFNKSKSKLLEINF
jgi:hypothetical protein